MRALVIVSPNPFQFYRRQTYQVKQSLTVQQWLDSEQISEFKQPTICLQNGQALLRQFWSTTLITDQQLITFVTLPLGGSTWRSILGLAALTIGVLLGGWLAGFVGLGAIGSAVFSAAGGWAAASLFNYLLPPPDTSNNLSSPSPTYTLQAQQNQARLGQPIPVVYGRHLIYPDLASAPYSVYQNNEQYLCQLLCLGQGEYEVEQIRIEDTPISSFSEISYQVVAPNEEVTLFAADVVSAPEVARQELTTQWSGPFVANPPHTQTTKLELDLILPRGLYHMSGSDLEECTLEWTVQIRPIDNAGEALTSTWRTLATKTITMTTNQPQQMTFSYSVSAGRYQVRMKRIDEPHTSHKEINELRWVGLKAYLNSTQNFGNVTLLAMKMRATDNLSSLAARMVNCLVTRKLPTWNRQRGWSPAQPTNSIAWAIADVCRARYGAKLTDQQLDLASLARLHDLWSVRGDSFNAVFDQVTTAWEALVRIARCGRSACFMQSGMVRIVRDQAKTMPVALFSDHNIVKNSLRIKYLLANDDTTDAVTVDYFSELTWRPDQITVTPTGSSGKNPAKIQLFGCTNREQAEREGKYLAAANRYRRRLVVFQTEMEGLIPTYNDLIAITHDMPSWGQSREITAVEGRLLTVSEPLQWQAGQEHFVVIRKNDGSVSGPWSVTQGPEADQLLLSQQLDFELDIKPSQAAPQLAFEVSGKWSSLARIISVRPRQHLVEIHAVLEHQAVHRADLN